MRVVVVTPPSPVVSLELAKAHLRVDGGDDDVLLTGLIAAATGGLDGPDGWLGRALGRQTLRAFPDHFACGWRRSAIALPCPPTRSQDSISVTTVSYSAGTAPVVLDPSAYSMDGTGRYLRLAAGSLPWNACDLEVEYQTGTAVPVDEQGVPIAGALAPIADEVKAAILLVLGSLYANREGDVIDARAVVAENPLCDRLLNHHRIWV